MIIANLWVESGCSFSNGEYHLDLSAVVNDNLDLKNDIEDIESCIDNSEIDFKEEILYTIFLHRANISTALPGYEPAFDIQQIIENISDINIQL